MAGTAIFACTLGLAERLRCNRPRLLHPRTPNVERVCPLECAQCGTRVDSTKWRLNSDLQRVCNRCGLNESKAARCEQATSAKAPAPTTPPPPPMKGVDVPKLDAPVEPPQNKNRGVYYGGASAFLLHDNDDDGTR